MKKKAFIKKMVDETGLSEDFFLNDFDELDDDTEPEDEELGEDEILEEILGLNEDFSLEDFMDCWDP